MRNYPDIRPLTVVYGIGSVIDTYRYGHAAQDPRLNQDQVI